MARLRHAPNDTIDGDFDGHLVVGVDLEGDRRLPRKSSAAGTRSSAAGTHIGRAT
jgi:hypothetical protein